MAVVVAALDTFVAVVVVVVVVVAAVAVAAAGSKGLCDNMLASLQVGTAVGCRC